MMSQLVLNVRFNSNHSIRIEVNPEWSIDQIKQELQQYHGVSPENYRIIFQGRELPGTTLIKDCNFANYSVVHAVTGTKRKRLWNSSRLGLNQLTEFREQDESKSLGVDVHPVIQYRPQYFVYCKMVCQSICPGKIRVRCAKCKLGTFVVDRDPCDWDDVKYGQITGHCEEDGCDGDIAEFYFKCAGHDSMESDFAVPLECIRVNIQQVPCITCMDIGSPIIVFPCDSHHSMCLDCFHIYSVTKLNDRAFVEHSQLGYTLQCPAGCAESFITEGHHFRILGNEQYDRYQKFGAEECLLLMGGVLCPRPGCGAGLLPDEGVRRVVCIQGCGYVFCRNCMEAYHQDDCDGPLEGAVGGYDDYKVNQQNAEQARWDHKSKDTIKKTTKPCPKCKVPIERDGGCMHMKCSRCCYQWCWLCQTEWNRECQGDHWFG